MARILIGCECSGRIRDEFIALGHDAMSCDFQESETPGPHYKGNLLDVLYEDWDLGIFHPDCTKLCFSGERWIKERGGQADRAAAFKFFKLCYYAPIPMVCVENSHSIFLNKAFRKPDQTVHPYHFGDPFKKSICLWLRGLPPIIPTNILPIGKRYPAVHRAGPGPNRSKDRARTYPGFAKAAATQWSNHLNSNFILT